jgi:hypothetical protein
MTRAHALSSGALARGFIEFDDGAHGIYPSGESLMFFE